MDLNDAYELHSERPPSPFFDAVDSGVSRPGPRRKAR
jgi:hypothetical protein